MRKNNPILQMKPRIRWLGEREIIMTMMNIYINSSWKENLQEANDGMGGGVGWWGDIWVVTL